VTFERLQRLTPFQVPESQRWVTAQIRVRGRDGADSVGRDRQMSDLACMALERAQGLAGVQIPEPQRLVRRSRNGTPAVGGDRHGVDRVRMALERAQGLAAFQVPHPQRVVI